MLYTFYENINDYRMAALEYQKVSAEREFYATQLRIKKKDDEMKSCSGYDGGG